MASQNNLRDGDLTGIVIGAAMEVHNHLGHGLLEKPYENALAVELERRSVPFAQQPSYEILFKGHLVGTYIPDLVVADKVVVDTKVVDGIGQHELGQMLNYLRIAQLHTGLVINFQRPKLEWKRVSL